MDFKSLFKKNSSDSGDDATLVPGAGLLAAGRKRRNQKLPFEGALPYILIAIAALMAADLTSLYFRSLMIPNTAPPAKRPLFQPPVFMPRTAYDNILSRNIFNSDGFIPEIKTDVAQGNLEGPARESNLPLTLVGTIVHVNPGKCVATIQLKGNADKVIPYIPNDDIEGMATLMKVERKKAFIRNIASGAYEYIQIKDEGGGLQIKKVGGGGGGNPNDIIQKEGDNQFAISRTDLETQMQNLPALLTQARAVANPVPGQPGKVDGFRILDIADGSLYSKLGVKNGDIIKGVDGEPLDSPAKAMELYNSLRNKAQVRLLIERNGQTSTMTYNIR